MTDTGEERKNRSDNVRKVRIRPGESVNVGRFAGRQGCFGTLLRRQVLKQVKDMIVST